MEGGITLADMISNVTSLVAPVKSVMTLFLEPPMLFFTCAAALCVVIGLAKKFIPTKRR